MSTENRTQNELTDADLDDVAGGGGRIEPIASRRPKDPGVDLSAGHAAFDSIRPKDDLAMFKEVEIHKPKRF